MRLIVVISAGGCADSGSNCGVQAPSFLKDSEMMVDAVGIFGLSWKIRLRFVVDA
jgi:hypothetical protein